VSEKKFARNNFDCVAADAPLLPVIVRLFGVTRAQKSGSVAASQALLDEHALVGSVTRDHHPPPVHPAADPVAGLRRCKQHARVQTSRRIHGFHGPR